MEAFRNSSLRPSRPSALGSVGQAYEGFKAEVGPELLLGARASQLLALSTFERESEEEQHTTKTITIR